MAGGAGKCRSRLTIHISVASLLRSVSPRDPPAPVKPLVVHHAEVLTLEGLDVGDIWISYIFHIVLMPNLI